MGREAFTLGDCLPMCHSVLVLINLQSSIENQYLLTIKVPARFFLM